MTFIKKTLLPADSGWGPRRLGFLDGQLGLLAWRLQSAGEWSGLHVLRITFTPAHAQAAALPGLLKAMAESRDTCHSCWSGRVSVCAGALCGGGPEPVWCTWCPSPIALLPLFAPWACGTSLQNSAPLPYRPPTPANLLHAPAMGFPGSPGPRKEEQKLRI